jgi:hypothetical protein
MKALGRKSVRLVGEDVRGSRESDGRKKKAGGCGNQASGGVR